MAMIFNNGVMSATADDLKAYSSPIAYLTKERFSAEFDKMVDRLDGEKSTMKECGYQATLLTILDSFRFATLSTKHPGFEEEKECRVIYTPDLRRSDLISKSIEIVGGVPQIVYKLPIRDLSKLEAILIGPTNLPRTIRDTFVDILLDAEIFDAAQRVVVSDIPLRR